MTFGTLLRRSLRFHARSHFGVVLGAAIGTAALAGALLVGDSVRESLRRKGLEGTAGFHYALSPGDRFFTAALSERLGQSVQGLESPAAVLALPGIVTSRAGGARANHAQILGVSDGFWSAPGSGKALALAGNEAYVNGALASQLAAAPGTELLVRVQKPTALSGDASLTAREDSSVTLRLQIKAILPAEAGGNFSLQRSQLPPLNLFVSRELLAETAQIMGKANLLVTGRVAGALDEGEASVVLTEGLRKAWRIEDLSLSLLALTNSAGVELRTSRVFLDPPVERAAESLLQGSSPRGVLTYLANTLENGERVTPYSFVTAAGPPFTPEAMGPEEVLVNEWLAEDLGVKVGDTLKMSYFLPESGARLTEGTNEFKVRGVAALTPPWDDRTLMPDFPGVEKAESTRDWDFGFELVHTIRPKDEDYWKARRGTPKAFITLGAGQRLWGNRFGNVTSLRWSAPAPKEIELQLERGLREKLVPAELGFKFEPIRLLALQGANQSQDFGQLFIGFSFFLVIAALLLMALLFQFGLEQRSVEVGTLLALGFKPREVRRLLLGEGAALAFIGGLLGLLGGILYARGMLEGLTSIWRSAVGTQTLGFHATPATLITGLVASTLVAVFTIWLSLRKQARQPARELLAEGAEGRPLERRSRGAWVAGGAGVFALAILGWAVTTGQTASAGVFFGVGALVLVAGLAATSAWLAALSRARETDGLSKRGLAVRAAGRRRKRSVATVALLACGCFVIVALGAFRLDASRDVSRQSGTGGFALIGETTLPVYKDLNSAEGRDYFALTEREMENVRVVPFRVRRGDDASCLNLNRAQRPRLLGVQPELLQDRFTFTAAAKGLDRAQGWRLLKTGADSGEVAAIGDAASIQWALGKKVGDTLDYTDERGRVFKVRLVGAVANSILQGSLIVDEAQLLSRYPSESGYRMYFIDAPEPAAVLAEKLTRALGDVGLEVTRAVDRLNAFNAVQNTYLGTFQFLGGLGLLLGSAGLGIVVLRNVLERRGELGLFSALGFRPATIRRLIIGEHLVLLLWGLGLGVLAAGIAVLPALITPGSQLPWRSLALTLGAVLLNGLAWTWLASRWALRGNLLGVLCNE